MSPADILDVARDGILTVILVSAPMMLVGLVVGVLVSLVQALTQIQEQTLVFVPDDFLRADATYTCRRSSPSSPPCWWRCPSWAT